MNRRSTCRRRIDTGRHQQDTSTPRPRGVLRFAALAVLLGACAGREIPLELNPVRGPHRLASCTASCSDSLEVTYLGVGGVVLRYGRDVIMTAPHFSTPSAARILAGPIQPNRARIDRRMRALVYEPRLLAGADPVSAILVGHGHYDHLMDVPEIVRRPGFGTAVILGNRTVENLLALNPVRARFHEVESHAATRTRMGSWLYLGASRRVRVLPVTSMHAAQIPLFRTGGRLNAIRLFRPYRRRPLHPSEASSDGQLPEGAGEYAEGRTLAYLIDFLDASGAVRFRVHYQDAASGPDHGLPPQQILEERATDLAIVTVGNYDMVRDYPQHVLRGLDPRWIMLAHWEDFITRHSEQPPRLLRVVRPTDLLQRLRDTRPADSWFLPFPEPGATVRLVH